jgi:2,4-dienoyl-CoA reductase-like NADH-dependent reductase (Old Yellow Enzyme family)
VAAPLQAIGIKKEEGPMYAEKMSKLFEPIKIGNIELKNRIKLPPVATGFAGSDCRVTESLKAFYTERAIRRGCFYRG